MKTAVDWREHCASEMSRANLCFGHGTDNAYDEAAWMVLHVLGAPLDGSFEHWGAVLSESQQTALESLLEIRVRDRLPLAYLTGVARFCGMEFVVTPDVLVPRSPMAELISGQFAPWFNHHAGGRVLDMCTGGGCIAIAMAAHMPGIQADAVDISAAALDVAARNVAGHAVADRVTLLRSDLFAELAGSRYDLIVSNPPYVAADVFARLPAEYQAEPANGLVCGEDGLDIVLKILDASPRHLNERGILVVEVGESAGALAELLPGVPFLWLEFECGGSGVFLLERDQLTASGSDLRAVLEQRKNV